MRSGALLLLALGSVDCSPADVGAFDLAERAPDLAPAPPDLSLPSRAPSDHPLLPQLDNFGGAPLAAMEIVTIVWKGDDALGQRVDQFHRWMLGSSYWTQSLLEYGVLAGKSGGVVVLPDAAPASVDDSWFRANLQPLIAKGTLPVPNANTTYAFILPPTSQSTLYGAFGCQDYGGYHSEAQTGSGMSPYEVNLQCPDQNGNVDFDRLTSVLSHEAAEAATDAHPFTRPGWQNQTLPLGGEVGDLCVGLEVSEQATLDQGDAGTLSERYVVTRLYSQAAAHVGTSDPCLPAPPHPYFNVGVEPPDWTVNLDASGNATATARIEPWSFGNVGDIKWRLERQPGRHIFLTPSQGTAKPGDTLLITVTAAGAQPNTYPIVIYAQSAAGTNQWFSALTLQ